jgi:hypothetical protein
MTPAQARAALDRALAKAGEDAVLQRLLGEDLVPVSVTLRASIRDYQPVEIAGGVGLQAGDSKLVISTTEIDAAGWPGADPEAQTPGDPRILREGDRIIVEGKTRVVLAGWPAPRIAGELIRIEAAIR